MQIGNSSRRLHSVPFLSAENRKLRPQVTCAHQNCTIEGRKNVWSDESCDISYRQFRLMVERCGQYFLGTPWAPQHWIVGDHAHPYMTTVHPSSDGYQQHFCAISQSSNPLKLDLLNVTLTGFHSHLNSYRASLGVSHHGCSADNSAATMRSCCVNMNQNLWGMFPPLRQIYTTRK